MVATKLRMPTTETLPTVEMQDPPIKKCFDQNEPVDKMQKMEALEIKSLKKINSELLMELSTYLEEVKGLVDEAKKHRNKIDQYMTEAKDAVAEMKKYRGLYTKLIAENPGNTESALTRKTYNDELRSIRLKIAKQSWQEVLLVHHRAISKQKNDVEKQGSISLGKKDLQKIIKSSRGSFFSFVKLVFEFLLKPEVVVYFSLCGSRETSTQVATLALPKKFVADFFTLVSELGIANKQHLNVPKAKNEACRYQVTEKIARKSVCNYLVKLRSKMFEKEVNKNSQH